MLPLPGHHGGHGLWNCGLSGNRWTKVISCLDDKVHWVDAVPRRSALLHVRVSILPGQISTGVWCPPCTGHAGRRWRQIVQSGRVHCPFNLDIWNSNRGQHTYLSLTGPWWGLQESGKVVKVAGEEFLAMCGHYPMSRCSTMPIWQWTSWNP